MHVLSVYVPPLWMRDCPSLTHPWPAVRTVFTAEGLLELDFCFPVLLSSIFFRQRKKNLKAWRSSLMKAKDFGFYTREICRSGVFRGPPVPGPGRVRVVNLVFSATSHVWSLVSLVNISQPREGLRGWGFRFLLQDVFCLTLFFYSTV